MSISGEAYPESPVSPVVQRGPQVAQRGPLAEPVAPGAVPRKVPELPAEVR